MSNVILILGGNGFIGAEVVEYLLDNYKKTEFVLLNRGHWNDWDNKTRIKSRVNSLIWDRKEDSIETCLSEYFSDENFKFEAIIDFSAYKKKDVKRVLKEMPSHRFNIYILISSDSVYEVSIDKESTNERVEFIETDSVRPQSKIDQEKLKKNDSYGHHKLGCEECLLEKAFDENDLNYVIIRVSDVIGGRDSTERFWFYQMWMQYLLSKNELEHDVLIPGGYLRTKTSYTYVKDIARAIYTVLTGNIRNEIFNLSCESDLSLIDFHNLIAKTIQPGFEKKFKYSIMPANKSDYHLFPSVEKGSSSIKKIKSLLNFVPTDIETAFAETIQFYDQAYARFPDERRQIEKSVRKAFFAKPESVDFEQFVRSFKGQK